MRVCDASAFEAMNMAESSSHTMMLAVALALAAATPATADVARPQDAQTLLTHFKCYICHADRETKAGPAFVDVAATFRRTPSAVSVIAREIRRGLRRGGPWHMPPHPEVSQAQARTIARYIMSLER
jgi:cytochrome c